MPVKTAEHRNWQPRHQTILARSLRNDLDEYFIAAIAYIHWPPFFCMRSSSYVEGVVGRPHATSPLEYHPSANNPLGDEASKPRREALGNHKVLGNHRAHATHTPAIFEQLAIHASSALHIAIIALHPFSFLRPPSDYERLLQTRSAWHIQTRSPLIPTERVTAHAWSSASYTVLISSAHVFCQSTTSALCSSVCVGPSWPACDTQQLAGP
ncbi:hypothetical protein A0H81_13240 [Grifola frondosa]|uniref:Uncharacterized protein n=1 Tax=Grifola frondosa TaxID=5627 RepID=A0A1C7LRX9_GRIFR|nr:hypothetical protein A0H81_13240 [Grifola frondosa]